MGGVKILNQTGEFRVGGVEKSGFKGTKMAIPCERGRGDKKDGRIIRGRCHGFAFKMLIFSCVFDMSKTRFPPLSSKIAVLLLSDLILALSSTKSSDSAREGSKF